MDRTDYGVYRLEGKEKFIFYSAGYAGFFLIGMIFYNSVVISCITGLFILLLRKPYEEYKAKSRQNDFLMQFKDLLYSLSASIATGRDMHEGFREALDNLGGMYKDSDIIIIELNNIVFGLENRGSENELLKDFASRSHLREVSGFTDVYLSVRDSGGDMESAISRTCDTLMDRITIEKEIHKIVSQKKLEARIITAIPLVILTALKLFSPEYISPMYTTLAGRIIMTVCLGLIIIAYVITERITDIRI